MKFSEWGYIKIVGHIMQFLPRVLIKNNESIDPLLVVGWKNA